MRNGIGYRLLCRIAFSNMDFEEAVLLKE